MTATRLVEHELHGVGTRARAAAYAPMLSAHFDTPDKMKWRWSCLGTRIGKASWTICLDSRRVDQPQARVPKSGSSSIRLVSPKPMRSCLLGDIHRAESSSGQAE